MGRGILGLIIVTTAVVAVAAEKEQVDHDRAADLGSYATFAWVETAQTSLRLADRSLHEHIQAAVEREFAAAGLEPNGEDPDLFVTYHAARDGDLRFDIATLGYRYGIDWYWGGGIGTSTGQGDVYPPGTLVIDVWDARTKKVVWRGAALNTVSVNPRKAPLRVDAAVRRLAAEWQKMAGGRSP